MLPYRLYITYCKDEIEFKIMILDDVIMIKTYYVTDKPFSYENFDDLIVAMTEGRNYEINYYNNDYIIYDNDKDLLMFKTINVNDNSCVCINMFNNDNNNFINEFKKVKNFINYISKNL